MSGQFGKYSVLGGSGGGGGGLTSINAQTGPGISIVGGTGITVVTGSNLITISAPGGTGTVTSVGLALPGSLFTVTGSPVTTSGTLTGSFVNQAQNSVFAGPTSGSGVPVFRSLVAADIPSLSSGFIGVLPIANGGTNSSTALNNNRNIISSGGAIVESAAITANRALASNSSGIPVASTTTDTELGFVSGVTSSIQTQLNGKQATGNYITALTGDVVATGPGSVTATIQPLAVTTGKINNNAVDNTKLAQMPAFTFKANNTAGTANAQDITVSAANAMLGTAGVPYGAVQTTNFSVPNTAASQIYPIDTTGGTVTSTFPAASTVPNGIEWTFKDVGGNFDTNPFTVTPNGADTIEGLNNPREYRTNYGAVTYTTDGISKWWGVWSRSRITKTIFTSSGTWTCPAGVTKILIRGRPGSAGGGGGGAGGLGFVGNPGGGGGGGAAGRPGGSSSVVEAYINVTPGTTYTVTVGAGGAGGTGGVAGNGTSGGNGGTSAFDAFVTFGKNTPATGATGGGLGGAGGTGTGAAGGGAGALGGVVGTDYGVWVDALPVSLAGGAGGSAAGGNGTSVGNSVATVPLYFATSNPGANGGTGGAGAGGTNGGGGGGGAAASAGFPETFPIDGQPAASGGTGGNGGNGGLGNAGGAGGAGSNGTAGTNGVSGMGGGGGGGGGGAGSGTTASGARGQGANGGNGSNGIILLEWVG